MTPALDKLRGTVDLAEKMRPGPETPVVHTAAQLRAVLDEVDALRAAASAYIAARDALEGTINRPVDRPPLLLTREEQEERTRALRALWERVDGAWGALRALATTREP